MKTPDARAARIAAHQESLKRYAWLLTTQLTDLERAFIHRRIDEEHEALEKLSAAPDDMAGAHIAAPDTTPAAQRVE